MTQVVSMDSVRRVWMGSLEITELIRRLGIRTLELPAEAAQRLGAIRAATGLKLPDCCVLHAAETSRAAVATFDRTLAARARECGLTVVDSPDPA